MRASIVRVCLLCSLLLPAIASAAEPRTPAEFQQEIDAIRIALGVLKKRMEVHCQQGANLEKKLCSPEARPHASTGLDPKLAAELVDWQSECSRLKAEEARLCARQEQRIREANAARSPVAEAKRAARRAKDPEWEEFDEYLRRAGLLPKPTPRPGIESDLNRFQNAAPQPPSRHVPIPRPYNPPQPSATPEPRPVKLPPPLPPKKKPQTELPTLPSKQ